MKGEAMKLTVMDRFVLGDTLPMEGTLLDMVLSKNIRSAVEFNEEELGALEITRAGGLMKWNVEAAEGITPDVEFNGPQTALIVKRLQELDTTQKLTGAHLGLCELFGIGKVE